MKTTFIIGFYFFNKVGRLLLAGLEEEKWGEEDRAERKSRLDRHVDFLLHLHTDKKKMKFSSYKKEIQRDRVQSHM
jgi:hypothetical protein